MEQKYTIYKHTSPSGKSYIGQTSCDPVSKRWLPNPATKYRTSVKLRNAINKYGWHNFKTDILATDLNSSEANDSESILIKEQNTVNYGYNLQSGGRNFRHSEETKLKIGESNKGKLRSKEFKENMRVRQKQRMTLEYRAYLSDKSSRWHHTEEAKAKIGASSIGNINVLGRKQPDSEKLLRSLAAMKVKPLACGHKRHNRYTKSCIINIKEILNENNNDPTSEQDSVS